MIKKSLFIKSLILVVFTALLNLEVKAQQDPQFTHYMYNTMSVNPGYAGQREVLSATALYRTQWVGIDGAPKTITFGIHSPLKNDRIGLGLNIVSDQLGPATETSFDANLSYTIPVNESNNLKLSFGLKAGLHMLDTDWSKGNATDGDPLFGDDISLTSPTLGAGLYLHSEKWYLGLAVPNILETNHYDNEIESSVATERFHLFLIGGYVFDLSDNTKLKPAFLVKGVSGAPIIADLSANVLFNDKFTLGLSYRWDDSVSGLAGFQVNPGLFVGYAYDATTTGLNAFNGGTHEVMLRFELQQIGKILSPRFF
ncbi:type IX secretion system membrane protein PorP/SprF [uncultured Algibacter sp.]|uniref:PorP/SprF family type IX secretion system membrane protein n=1 Tax=uncultured Algibacter sp. TaxID=298659 RepID=UPI00260B4C7D|nr:type IX secretion system membrane protein PorP/SprF [uncultured Algibacter sp.]